MNYKKIIKVASLSVAISSVLFSANVFALEQASSRETPTIKGWRPYLESVGAIYASGITKKDRLSGPQVGDIILVPTDLVNEKLYGYKDGNGVQDGDANITTRVRADHAERGNQKVMIKWFIVDSDKKFADEGVGIDLENGIYKPSDWDTNSSDYVISWDDLTVQTEITDAQSLRFLNSDSKSLALIVPPAAAGKRVGFIIQAESQTGDPFRGDELKVPDLNFLWSQNQPVGPGECGDVDPSEKCDDNTNPLNPEEPNIEGPGGEVGSARYIVTIRHQLGAVKDPENDPPVELSTPPYPVVNETYWADIKILKAEAAEKLKNDPTFVLSAEDYRPLSTQEELESITWEFKAVGLNPDGSLSGTDEGPMTVTWNGTPDDKLLDAFTIRLQETNTSAQTYWQSKLDGFSEKSEQRASLKVSFGYDETQ